MWHSARLLDAVAGLLTALALLAFLFAGVHLLLGSPLFPLCGEARWTALRRHALGNGMLDTLLLWRSELAKPAARQTPEWLTTFARKIRNALEVIESDADALARSPIDIGHIGIGVALAYLDFRFAGVGWRDGHPRTDAWMQQFLQREPVQKTTFIDA